MGTRIVVEPGAIRALPGAVAAIGARAMLVVGSRRAVRATGLHDLLGGRDVHTYDGFTTNPRLADLQAGAALRARLAPGVVVGVGGGSALDAAKVVRALRWPPGGTEQLVRSGFPLDDDRPPLVLIPTTAGSGSEVTCFATVYHRGAKLSVDAPGLAADLALVDADLTHSCDPGLTASAAFDAVAHAIESWWSRRATKESRDYARRALALLWPAVTRAGTPGPARRSALMAGAHWAGRAINISRTTAAHAFSYDLTIRYGVPHGLACMLNLPWLVRANLAAGAPRLADIAGQLGCRAEELDDRLTALIRAHGWSPRLRDHGVSRGELAGLIEHALGNTQRATNNPVALDAADVRPYLEGAW